jgi:hypothetical protein
VRERSFRFDERGCRFTRQQKSLAKIEMGHLTAEIGNYGPNSVVL